MQSGQPSRTALSVAALRAIHQVLEQGRIFFDPLALRILGADGDAYVRDAEQHPERRALRIFVAVRSRFAEDALMAAVSNGVTQLVILGAGLDTFPYRNTLGDRLRIFEVDYPSTQAWKRQRLADADIAIPNTLTFAPVDFERGTLEDGLRASGFDASQRTFFTWLGVVPYLTEQAIFATLDFIAKLPGGAQVVFDYGNPPESRDPQARAAHDQRAAYVAAVGEAFVSYFDTDVLREKLSAVGFLEIEDLGPRQIAERYFPARAGSMPEKGGHVVRARSPMAK
jgi:methyltransferase (TIGR00027 family)